MRKPLAVLAVAAALGSTANPAAAAIPLDTIGPVGANARLDSDGVMHVQYDFTDTGPDTSVRMVLLLRVGLDDDPDRWQLLHHDTLMVRGPGGPIPFTTSSTDDALTVEIPETPRPSVPVTVTFDTHGAASASQVLWEFPSFTPVAASVTMNLRGPGELTGVDCVGLPTRQPCDRVTNLSAVVASAAWGHSTFKERPRLSATYADGALTRDARTFAERLTPRTWLRHWWPALVLGVVGVAGGAWWLRRRPRATQRC